MPELTEYDTILSADSATSSNAAATGNGFWLVDPTDPALNIRISLAGDLEHGTEEAQGVFRLLGRDRAVVLDDASYAGEVIRLPILFHSKAEWDAFETLRRMKRVLLLRTDMNSVQWYGKLGASRPVRIPASTSRIATPHRFIQVDFIETDPPVVV